MASQLHFARHRNTRSPLVRLASNTTGIRRARAGQGAAYGVLAQTPSLTRMNEDPRICQALLRSIFNVDHYDFRSSLMTVICVCFGLNNPLYSFYLAKTFIHLEFSVSVQLFYNSICIETNEHSKLHFKLLAPSANRKCQITEMAEAYLPPALKEVSINFQALIWAITQKNV